MGYGRGGRGWSGGGGSWGDWGGGGGGGGGGGWRDSGGKGGGGKGGGGKGGGGKGGNKPFWRQFVDPSDDPETIRWVRQQIQEFLDSREQQREMGWMSNQERNTFRAYAPEMGAGWIKVDKGVFALVRASAEEDPAVIRRRLVNYVRKYVEDAGGSSKITWVWKDLPTELSTDASVKLRMKKLYDLMEKCPTECAEADLRVRGKSFVVGDADDYSDAYFVRFDTNRVAQAKVALQRALRQLPALRGSGKRMGANFLEKVARGAPLGPEDLERERSLAGYKKYLPQRQRLPAFKMAAEICAAVRRHRVTLILGATGCGKTTQIPQVILEDAASRDEPCVCVATQPRRISAMSVSQRVATERGGRLGDRVAYKIRFEDEVTETTPLIFCTVGVLIQIMESNPLLEGATHVIVDEVHERDLHTDFMLTLLRRVLKKRSDLKVVLMSATVDPTAFQEYFTDAHTLSIPGKTNYPIEELFLEDVLQNLAAHEREHGAPPEPFVPVWKQSKASAFSSKQLERLPMDAESIKAALPRLPRHIAEEVATAHAGSPEDIDFHLVQRVVEMIHYSGEDGGILIFMPGWGEIKNTKELLEKSAIAHELELLPLHSRMPSSEQTAIFDAPPRGKRKVVIATILAETSITIDDIVFVVDAGRSKTTFFNEDSKVAALKTTFYSKANGFQRRGRAGRCRPGQWLRLYSSFMWEAMAEYELPEMLRSPLEELCLRICELRLGDPQEFLQESVSPPKQNVVRHAMTLLENLGAVRGGRSLTPLGENLCKLQVHPMLGKMLLLAGLFRCSTRMVTMCAALGYKSPFLSPMGKEAEADMAKRAIADESQSDHIALVNAYNGWCQGKAAYARRNFLSLNTLEYIHRLRGDLVSSARDILDKLPNDHSNQEYLDNVCRAVLVAGLFPRLAWIGARGKGETLDSLKVTVHPGSVNKKEAIGKVVVFYDIQETTDRWIYDTTLISMAPCMLFAPELRELARTEKRVVFQLNAWQVALEAHLADEVLELRELLADFISRSVGQAPTEVHTAATDALSQLFQPSASGVLHGDGEDDDPEESQTPRGSQAAGDGRWSGGGPQEKRGSYANGPRSSKSARC